MPEGEEEFAKCQQCQAVMDLGGMAPFSNVSCPVCATPNRVKREFGPYTLVKRYAIGGMSVVFLARDRTLDREVIVKILNEEYGGNDRRIAAFEEEARLTASFSHPNVVKVYTTGRAFGRFYIAMEFVPGGHFEHHIGERGTIPEAELLPLAAEVAEGLKAAHAAGLIHRDMKPGNILLDSAGHARIVDFGLALVTKGGKAQATEIWATPYYVPPETIEGLPEDFRSDIYAFGATLYHALAGKPSCDEESMDTLRLREAKRRVEPLAKAAPHVSAETCALVDRAMAHDPAGRFGSYAELLAAIESARQRLAGIPAAVPKSGTSASGRRAKGRGERAMLLSAGAGLLAAAGFGAWWLSRDGGAPDGGVDRPIAALPGPVEGGGTPVDAGRIAAAYREAGEAVQAGDFGKARALFAEVRDSPGVLQPTGAWAACEAVAAAYFDGQAGEARKEAAAARSHLETAAGLDAELRERLDGVLEALDGLAPVLRHEAAPPPAGADWLVALLGGLKNWEHGMPERAAAHFQAITGTEASEADAWVRPYQALVGDYLADREVLAQALPAELPTSPDACRAMADELHAVRGQLRTKGRAPFNLRAVQLELEKRARRPVTEPPAPEPEEKEAGSFAAILKAAGECRFEEAVASLKALDPADARATGMLAMAEAASAFLSELEDLLAAPPDGVVLETRDGMKIDRIESSRPGGVKGLDASGSPRDLPWAEISPASLIDLHRQLVKEETRELDRLRRHEQAIAFDLLAGDASRGKRAAEGLAARYPAFKRRWELMQAAL